jgi:GNAT superfamily N-acetyltransferase
MNELTIIRASAESLQDAVQLFDAYRQYYGQAADPDGAREFLADRLTKGESVVFLASKSGHAVGFAQLYPSFSSVSMKPIWILNDLFVSSSVRGQGVGTALLERCKHLAVETGAKEMILETMKTNLTAQRLYEERGWKRDNIFYRYSLST